MLLLQIRQCQNFAITSWHASSVSRQMWSSVKLDFTHGGGRGGGVSNADEADSGEKGSSLLNPLLGIDFDGKQHRQQTKAVPDKVTTPRATLPFPLPPPASQAPRRI